MGRIGTETGTAASLSWSQGLGLSFPICERRENLYKENLFTSIVVATSVSSWASQGASLCLGFLIYKVGEQRPLQSCTQSCESHAGGTPLWPLSFQSYSHPDAAVQAAHFPSCSSANPGLSTQPAGCLQMGTFQESGFRAPGALTVKREFFGASFLICGFVL